MRTAVVVLAHRPLDFTMAGETVTIRTKRETHRTLTGIVLNLWSPIFERPCGDGDHQMNSGRALVWLLYGVIVLGYIWFFWKIFLPWNHYWENAFGLNGFTLVKFSAGVVLGFVGGALPFMTPISSNKLFGSNRIADRLANRLGFLPSERMLRAKRHSGRLGDKAADDGNIPEAIRLYARAGNSQEAFQMLGRLPDWPVRASLIDAAQELMNLERNLTVARKTNVPDAVTSRLSNEVRDTAIVLWSRAERIAATHEYGVDSPRLQQSLKLEAARIQELQMAIRDSREGLAELTLSGAGGSKLFEQVEARFRTLAEIARTLDEEGLG